MAPKNRPLSRPRAKSQSRAKAKAKGNPKGAAKAVVANRNPAPPAAGGPQPAPAISGPSSDPAEVFVSDVSSRLPEVPLVETSVPAPSVPSTEPDLTSGTGSASATAQKANLSIPDPWSEFGDDEAFQRVEAETWSVVELECDGTPDEAGVHVSAQGLERATLTVSETLQRVAVSLDLSGNSLTLVSELPPLWLRNLVLANNPLESLAGIADVFPKLLVLDLSFVDFSGVNDCWRALAACRSLRTLAAQGSSVSSLEGATSMPQLLRLDLQENDIEDMCELATIASSFPSLGHLDLRENPVAGEPGYLQRVRQHLPALVWHDNQSRRQYKPAGREDCGYNVHAEATAVDGLFKNETCSCLSGNPCIDPVTCMDWEHREVVAAEARRKKGLRDDFGRQL